MWFMVDPNGDLVDVYYSAFYTGEPIPGNPYSYFFAGTVQVGELVWHVFQGV